ncbi:MAG: FtsX-like permease family protein [Cellvibrionales bacterium]|jgi:lipoprotein-releasing system permease protein|nr:FtsX-like permease family protein [Cellvibrionales bacterium]
MLARFIALRYAQARSGSALLGFISRVSMAGLVVAVALLITVLAVMNGFEHELRTRILRVVPAITLYPEENEIAEWKVVAQEVLKNPQVTAASPLIEAQGLLVMGSAAEPVLLFATDPVAESKLSHFEEFTDASAWDAWLADPQSVLISRKLANKLGVQAGGTAVVMLPGVGGDKSAPGILSLRIAGLYETGTEVDNHLVMAQLPLLQAQYNIKGVAAIRFSVDNWLKADAIAWSLVQQLPPHYSMKTWLQTHGNLYEAIRMSRQLVVLMLVIIIVIAAFNVVCSLVLVVTDKRGDIAILRAMGLPNSNIMRIFMMHGLLIGTMGTVIGAVAGCALALAMPSVAQGLQALLGVQLLSTDVYPVNYLPSDLRVVDVGVVVGVALLISGVASVYPAWRATCTQPADVLRHE